jgi:biopolymer transport protein ExbD
MKSVKFYFVILLSVMVTSAFSQQGQWQQRTPEETAKTTVEWMKAELKLDDAKTKTVHNIILKYAKQTTEMRQKLMSAGDREGMREKMNEITAARDKELKPVLGDKTFELFKAKEAERRPAGRPQ